MRSTVSMALLSASLAFATSHALAHDLMTLDELMGAFGWDFDSAEITAEQHGEGLHVLFGLGGNIAVSIGEDGVLIVDDQFPQLVPKIEAKISELGGGAVDFAINTHWHFDHCGGQPGPRSAGQLAGGPSQLAADDGGRAHHQSGWDAV